MNRRVSVGALPYISFEDYVGPPYMACKAETKLLTWLWDRALLDFSFLCKC